MSMTLLNKGQVREWDCDWLNQLDDQKPSHTCEIYHNYLLLLKGHEVSSYDVRGRCSTLGSYVSKPAFSCQPVLFGRSVARRLCCPRPLHHDLKACDEKIWKKTQLLKQRCGCEPHEQTLGFSRLKWQALFDSSARFSCRFLVGLDLFVCLLSSLMVSTHRHT